MGFWWKSAGLVKTISVFLLVSIFLIQLATSSRSLHEWVHRGESQSCGSCCSHHHDDDEDPEKNEHQCIVDIFADGFSFLPCIGFPAHPEILGGVYNGYRPSVTFCEVTGGRNARDPPSIA